MLEWQPPKNLRELRGLVGLTGYYRKFVLNYAQIAHPLTSQLRKDAFRRSEEANVAFECLKQVMVSTPLLAMPDFGKVFIMETDASDYGLEVVLLQDNGPLAFYNSIGSSSTD